MVFYDIFIYFRIVLSNLYTTHNSVLTKLFVYISSAVSAIDCYQCSSLNFSDPFCHDPFHPAYNNLTTNCGEGRDGRVGLFPARFCTKITGINCKWDPCINAYYIWWQSDHRSAFSDLTEKAERSSDCSD